MGSTDTSEVEPPTGEAPPLLGLPEIRALMTEYQAVEHGLHDVEVRPGGLIFTVAPELLSVRRGGTISGPALFTLADMGSYVCLSAYRGPTPSAVLTSSSMSFLEAAEPGELQVRIAAERLGRRTAVFTARIEDGKGQVIALGTLHFAFPGNRGRRG